jgi:hypothetical protein
MSKQLLLLIALVSSHWSWGQGSLVTKNEFRSAIRKAERVAQRDGSNCTWKANNQNNSFFTSDSITFYNFDHPVLRASCRFVSWVFPNSDSLHSTDLEYCQEPAYGRLYPNGSQDYKLSLTTESNSLILKGTNNQGTTISFRVIELKQISKCRLEDVCYQMTLVKVKN